MRGHINLRVLIKYSFLCRIIVVFSHFRFFVFVLERLLKIFYRQIIYSLTCSRIRFCYRAIVVLGFVLVSNDELRIVAKNLYSLLRISHRDMEKRSWTIPLVHTFVRV